jgi:hypothetical protein
LDGGGFGARWNHCGQVQLVRMDNSSKTIGEGLRKILSGCTRLPMGWSLIDAFTRLEEREDAMRGVDEMKDSDDHPTGCKQSRFLEDWRMPHVGSDP